MNYENFILGKEQEPNPLYDKRTKAGRAQPKFVTVNDINHVDDSINRILEYREKDYWSPDWNETERKNFQSYGIIENQTDSERQLEKRKAENQSGWEQMAHSLGQIVVNEVILGSVLGLSDLADWIINIGNDLGEDDYTNFVSQALINAQDSIKERWAIYRENPDKSFDLGDAAWWWDNLVTVGSTASLMIPSMGVAKGLGMVGKFAKLATKGTKFDRGLYKASHWMAKVGGAKNAEKIALNTEHTINNFFKAAIPSVVSRQMEDMLEARETYKSTMDDVMSEFKNMTPEERKQFYARNSDIVYDDNGNLKSDEDIAKYIADKAATYTFVNDFKYIGFDFLQFSNLLRFGSKPLTRALNNATRKTLREMATGTERAAEELLESSGRMGVFKDALKFYAKNPRIAIKNIAETTEFTEGLEEMGQGITQNNAKNTYGRYFNPNYMDVTIASQLSDPQLWEQGFWGAIGGMVFKGIGKGGKYLWKKGKLAYNKNKYTDEDIHRLEATEESIRKEEVESRVNAAKQLEAKLKLWAAGYNPQQTVIDSEGNEVKLDYSDESQFTRLKEDEKELVYDNIINEYLTNMVVNAVDVGNGELLEAFIKDENFKKYIDRISTDNETANKLYNKMLNRFSDIKAAYYGNLEKVFGSVDVESEYIGKALAMRMTRGQLHIKDLNEEYDRLTNEILKLTDEAHYDNYLELRTIGEVNKAIGQLFNDKTKVENDKTINITQKRARLDEINKQIKALRNIGGIGEALKDFFEKNKDNLMTDINDQIQSLSDELTKLSIDEIKILKNIEDNIGSVPDAAKTLINQQIKIHLFRAYEEAMLLDSQKDIEEAYNDYVAAHEEMIDNKFKKARQKVLDYIINSENPTQAYQDLLEGNGKEDIQEEFDLFKIGNRLYDFHKVMFEAAANIEKKKDNASKKDDDVKEEPEVVKDNKENQQPYTNPSTGEQTKNKNKTQTSQTPQTKSNDLNNGEEFKEEETEEETEVETGDIILQTEDDIAAQEAIKLNPNLGTEGMDDSIQLDIDLSDLVLTTLMSMSSEEKIALREKTTESEAFKLLRDKLIEYLRKNEYSKNWSNEDMAKAAENSIATTISNLSSGFDAETKKKYLDLIKSIRELHKQAASTQNISNDTEEKIAEEIKEIINLHLKNNKYQTKNDRPIINIEKLFTELLGVYDKATLDLVNPILQYLRNDLKGEHKYYIEDSENISKYLNKPNELVQYLKQVTVQRQIQGDEETAKKYGNAFHAQMMHDAFRGFKKLQGINKGKFNSVDWKDKGSKTLIFNGYTTVTINNDINDINAYIDYQNAMYSYKNTPGARIVAFRFGTSIQYRVDDGSMPLDELKSEKGKYKTIGFMSTVEANKNNNSFSRDKSGEGKGLFFTVTKHENGTITSNFDNVLIGILEKTHPTAKMIYNHLMTNNNNFTKQELDDIEMWFDLKTTKDIRLNNYDKTKGLTNAGAQELLFEYIKNFLIDTPIRFNQNNFIDSYHEYINKVYDNYAKTFDIQSAIGSANLGGNYLVIEAEDTTQEIVTTLDNYVFLNSKNTDISSQKIVFVDTDNQIHVSGSNEVYENDGLYKPGSFGIMLTPSLNNTGVPAIAWLYSDNSLSKDKKIKQLLHDTLYHLIIKAYGKDGHKTKRSFTTLFNELTDLSGPDSIFYGINAKKVCDTLYTHQYSDLFAEREGSTIKAIDRAIDNLIEQIGFNLSFSLAKGKLAKKNRFVKIDSKGRITVSLTTKDGKVTKDTTLNYNSFGDFIVSTENYKIDQIIEKYNSMENDGQNSLFFSGKTNEVSPVKGDERIGTFNAVRQYLEKSNKETPLSTKELLIRAGFSKEDIDILFGENSGFTFVDGHIYYDKEPTNEEFAYFDPVTKHIAITNNIVKIANAGYREKNYKNDLARLVIHENVHKQFDSLSKDERKYLVTELSKLFLQFADYLNKDIAYTEVPIEEDKRAIDLAKKIAQAFANTRWSIDNINSIVNDIKEGKIDESAMNEFLAETLSQATLIEYLNIKEYTGAQYTIQNKNSSKKSIWQRIVDLITQFFTNFSSKDLQNIKNNSIFANEYRLLSNIGNNKIITKSDSKVAEQQQTPKQKRTRKKETNTNDTQTNIDFNEENNVTENKEKSNDNNDNADNKEERDFSDIDITDELPSDIDNVDIPFATTPLIGTIDEVRIKINDKQRVCDVSGAVRVSDMINFVQRFGKDKIADFSSMLNSGAFNYACK